MPDIHVPHLDEDEAESVPQPGSVPPRPHRQHSLLKILMEVVLITAGVFLGLAGESWRESRHHHELAEG